MKRIHEKVDPTRYRRMCFKGMTYYGKSKQENQPTHFSLELQENGMDKVRYYREIQSKSI